MPKENQFKKIKNQKGKSQVLKARPYRFWGLATRLKYRTKIRNKKGR